ncbi:MAG: ATPase [Bacteroidales bacterium]|jgi:N-acetylglucosamine kinase-like BadF-type ATPase|nr:ATPase [Bacteroidales bacterium]
MQLIADSGSTKVSWRAILDDGSVRAIETVGINPVFMEDAEIESILTEKLVPEIGTKVDAIFFYGAGMVGGEISAKLERCFGKVFPGSTCEAASDVLAAARALCGHKPGIACILGTGSNSCFYDGEGIAENVRAGGFILGDEASGAYLGKRLISDFIKGLLPAPVENAFKKRYGLDYMTIVQKVYREPMPSRFLASFSPFIAEFRNHPHIANLLKSSFEEFLRRNIIHYDYKKYPVNFVGSIAYYYKDILEKAVNASGMRMGTVLQGPIDGLVAYHKNTK